MHISLSLLSSINKSIAWVFLVKYFIFYFYYLIDSVDLTFPNKLFNPDLKLLIIIKIWDYSSVFPLFNSLLTSSAFTKLHKM